MFKFPHRLLLFSVCLMAALQVGAAGADQEDEDDDTEKPELPLWEVGVGVGAAVYPDFRGADHYNLIALPVPIVIYRGDFLRVDRDDARARLFDSDRFDINFTGGGAPPVNSDADNGRVEMPDLDATFRAGPSFDWVLTDPEDADSRLRFRLPVHAAFVADIDDFRGLGAVVRPHFIYNRSWRQADRRWSATLRAGVNWASGDFHDYYYTVDPQFARPGRPAFDAGDGGYGGVRLGAGMLYGQRKWNLGGYLSFDHLAGASFEESSLVATQQSYVVGLFASWHFWESEARAPTQDADDAPVE